MNRSPGFASLCPTMIASHRKVWRVCLSLLLGLLLLGLSLPAQAQTFTVSKDSTSDIWFGIKVDAMPSNTWYIDVTVSRGGAVIETFAHQAPSSGAPFTITIGKFDPATSYIKPATAYHVSLTAATRNHQFFTRTVNVTTTSERVCYTTGSGANKQYHNCPAVNISNEQVTDTRIEFQITPFAGADFYMIPNKHPAEACSERRTDLGPMGTWQPRARYSRNAYYNDPEFLSYWLVRYCGLKKGTDFDVAIEAYSLGSKRNNSRQATLIGRSVYSYTTKGNPPIGVRFNNGDTTIVWERPAYQQSVTLDIFRDGIWFGNEYEDSRTRNSFDISSHVSPGHNYRVLLVISLPAYRDISREITFTVPQPNQGSSLQQSQPNSLPAPTDTPAPTKPPPPTNTPAPIAITVDFAGTDEAILSWSVSNVAAGMVLEYLGDDGTNGFISLPNNAGSQRLTGLSPGAAYTAELTAYLSNNRRRRGEVVFQMPNAPPTATATPTTAATATNIPRPTIHITLHNATDITLSWSAVSVATGYRLEYSGGNNESGSYDLGAGVTSQRINGLSPGASYNAQLTVNLPGGNTKRGSTAFKMPAAPTATEVRARSQQPENTLIQTMIGYRDEQASHTDHYQRWARALAALGHGSHANPMTLAEAQQMADTYSRNRWQPVVDALTQLQQSQQQQVVDTATPTATPKPTATPTNTPTATPTSTPTATPKPTATPTALPTNTPTATALPTNTPVPQPKGPFASLMQTIIGYRDEQPATSDHYKRWARALAALGYMHSQVDAATLANPMTLSEAQGYVGRGWNRWQGMVDALMQLQPPTNTPVPPPTNTPVPPPTNTPVPPPTNTPVPPPTNTPVPPPTNTPVPPPTNTPVPPPTNTPVPPPTNTPVPQSYQVPDSLINKIKDWRQEQAPDSDHAIRWTRVLAAFGKADHSDPMTSSEAKIYRDERGWNRWIDVVDALEKLGK